MVIVPVKRFESAKQRLACVLEPEQRAALAEAMLCDVLDALSIWPRRARVTVVTADPHAASLARGAGCEVMPDAEERGESSAVASATALSVRAGADHTLVLPADIPLLAPSELDAIYDAAPLAGTVLVPARDQRGTNAVLRRPADLFPLRFGNDSFRPHLEGARATGRQVLVLRLGGVGLDVDAPADLAVLVAAPGQTRSQRLLRSWQIFEQQAACSHA